MISRVQSLPAQEVTSGAAVAVLLDYTVHSVEPSGAGRQRDRRASQAAGFTLLEMLIVLAIIGLLVALVGPRLLARLDTSKITTTETQIRMLRTALDTLRLDIGRYPTTEEGLDLLMTAPTDPDLKAKWQGPYLEGDMPNDAWGHPFHYTYTGVGNPPFALYSYGAEGKPSADGTNKGIGILPKS